MYLHELKGAGPGDRPYACDLQLSEHCTEVTRLLMPCPVELCCCKRPDREAGLRGRGYPVRYAVPVLADGSLDWKSARETWGMHFAWTALDAAKTMDGLCGKAQAGITSRILELQSMSSRVRGISNDNFARHNGKVR